MQKEQLRVAIVYPADTKDRSAPKLEDSRFAATATALRTAGLEVEGAPYADEAVEQVRAQLLRVDGVLVWVNPIEQGRDRSVLNAMLADVASTGVMVSAHPSVIDKMGTKEVLYRTRTMSWGCDTRLYASPEVMRRELPGSLATGPRVLKQIRGQSGDGIWKVELEQGNGKPVAAKDSEPVLCVRHAKRGSPEVRMSLDAFLTLCQPYFAGAGGMIDQAFQSRIGDGMVRCYLVRDRVAGFGEQLVNMLHPAAPGAPTNDVTLPGPRHYFPPTRADFQQLKDKLEGKWLGELCVTLDIDQSQLPVIWDADFMYGPRDADGRDTYVLCEINVSSVYPFPADALAPLAEETLVRMRGAR